MPAEPAAPAAESPGAAVRGRELVERAIAVKGGVDVLRAVRTVKATATTTLSTPQGAIPVETTTYIAYPDRFRVEAQSPAGALVQVYDAGQAWLRDPNGVREAPQAMRDDFAASVARDLVPLLLRIHDGQAEVHAMADVAGEDGRTRSAVEVTGADGDPVTLLFDPASGQVVGERYTMAGSGGSRDEVEETYADYRAVSGVEVPFSAVVRRQGATIIQRAVHTVEVNVPIDPGLFTRPPS